MKKAVIFDMGDVLFEVNRWGMVREIGYMNLIRYMIRHSSYHTVFDKIIKSLFQIMYHFGRQQSNNNLFATHQENELPDIVAKWQKGLITSDDLITSVVNRLHELKKQNLISHHDYSMLMHVTKIIHNPKVLAKHLQPIHAGWNLVKACKDKGFVTCILSNFDPETFVLLKKRYHKLFDTYCDEIVISGHVGSFKPEPDIYEHLLAILNQKYEIKPQDCWFIDDTPNNITAAQHHHINGVLLKNGNFEDVKKKLGI